LFPRPVLPTSRYLHFHFPHRQERAVFNPSTFSPPGFFSPLPVLSNIANILRITFCIFCLVAYCLIFLHSLLTSTRFGLLLLADLKFHFTTSRFEAHSINTYIEQSAGDSYFASHHPTPLSSFFTTRQTNQYGRNIFRLPYSDLSKVEFKSTHFATETLTEMPVANQDIRPHQTSA